MQRNSSEPFRSTARLSRKRASSSTRQTLMGAAIFDRDFQAERCSGAGLAGQLETTVETLHSPFHVLQTISERDGVSSLKTFAVVSDRQEQLCSADAKSNAHFGCFGVLDDIVE